MIHLITYDLHKPERDYEAVIEKVKSFGTGGWAHDEKSVWLVDTTSSTAACRDGLLAVTNEATFFVARLQPEWAAYGLPKDVAPWLNDARRRW